MVGTKESNRPTKSGHVRTPARRGIALRSHAIARAIGVRGTAVASTASSRTRKVNGTVRVGLTRGYDAVAGRADLPLVAGGVVGTRGNASRGARTNAR